MTSQDQDRYAHMRRALAQWATLSDSAWQVFSKLFVVQHVEQGAHLVLPGAPLHHLYFVSQGLLRFYYIDADGREWNKSFVEEGSLAGAFSSYVLGLPAPYAIEALEPTTVLAARWSEVASLYEADPVFDRLGRRFAEWLLVRKELRERAFLELDATERYQAFLSANPSLAARLPAYQIASYLGITEVALSRIKGKLGKEQAQ